MSAQGSVEAFIVSVCECPIGPPTGGDFNLHDERCPLDPFGSCTPVDDLPASYVEDTQRALEKRKRGEP